MSRKPRDNKDMSQDHVDAADADTYAQNMANIMMDIADLDPEICPPDLRYVQDGREAWVYEHGNIAELVFVKTD